MTPTLDEQKSEWEEEARRYAGNADYWRERAEKAEAELAAIKSAGMPGEPRAETCGLCGTPPTVTKEDYDALVDIAVRMNAEAEETSRKYHELIMQVGNKYPDETRHETALRYIRNAEANHDTVAKSAIEKLEELK